MPPDLGAPFGTIEIGAKVQSQPVWETDRRVKQSLAGWCKVEYQLECLQNELFVPESGGTLEVAITVMASAGSDAVVPVLELGTLAGITLQVWTPLKTKVTHLNQTVPIPLDLTGARVAAGPLTGDYPTGSWGNESRHYYLGLRLPPGNVDDVVLAARLRLLVNGEPTAQVMVSAVWTDFGNPGAGGVSVPRSPLPSAPPRATHLFASEDGG